MTILGRGLAVAAALALGGCDAIDRLRGDDVVLPCPAVRVVGDGDTFPRFREGAAAEPGNIVLTGRIVAFESECDYDDADDPASGMVMRVSVLVGAERTVAAGAAAAAPLPWFVAAIGPDRGVASKETFAAEIGFDGPEARVARSEPQDVDLRFPSGAALRPWEYEVLIGFQLDRQQLEYLRLRRP